jgi:hypothetical protein
MRRLLLAVGVLGGSILALSGCASQGYGSAGGFDEYYDDCYDGYCVGYDVYGRAYRRPPPEKRREVDRIDRSHGETRTVSRGTTHATAASASAAARMSASRPSAPPPPPTTVSRH